MSQHRRPRTRLGRILNHWAIWPTIVGFIIGAAIYGASDAHADGLDRSEADYILAYGPSAICPVIDEYPSPAGVLGVARGIAQDGFGTASIAQIINVAVYTYCPRHWPLLVAMGQAARQQGMTA